MKRVGLLLLLLLLCTPQISAQKRGSSRQLPEQIMSPTLSFAERLEHSYREFYNSGGVFEKLYLMTDKPYYSAGETIFFSGFLVHATLLTRNSSSMFVYAELISPEGVLIERIKVAAERKQFIGTFTLNPRLTSGRYIGNFGCAPTHKGRWTTQTCTQGNENLPQATQKHDSHWLASRHPRCNVQHFQHHYSI